MTFRRLPTGWMKDWDNLGCTIYRYKPSLKTYSTDDLSNLPSWVPNWNSWSVRDPHPFLSLGGKEELYWASGKNRSVTFGDSNEPDSSILCLRGMLFDGIKVLGQPWFILPQNAPISRCGVSTLIDWEVMALKDVNRCPYEDKGGRKDAFWRTHIADYSGELSASQEQKDFFDAWCDEGEWTPKPSIFQSKEYTSTWKVTVPMEGPVMWDMTHTIHSKRVQRVADQPDATVRKVLSTSNPMTVMQVLKKIREEYKAMRTRIYSASMNRTMFVTTKGYLGLAPWNARKGDLICVLLGGSTPFLLRPVPSRHHFTLVGECYVYGIMGGELFGHEMGHARLRDFAVV
jgi:hypothetical protein